MTEPQAASAPGDVRVESTFDVPSSPADAWAALEALRARQLGAVEGSRTWWLPGFECRGDELESDPGHGLIVRKADPPCEGTTVAMTFEELATGSRIRIVQSGFDPAFVREAGDLFAAHGAQLLAAAEAFFRDGA